MPLAVPLYGSQGFGPVTTATAGTVFNALCPPAPPGGNKNLYTRLLSLVYTIGANGHIITVMREKGRTTAAIAAPSGAAKVITLTADPSVTLLGPNGGASLLAANTPIAAGDYLVWEQSDGTYGFGLVASVSGLAITMTSNLPGTTQSTILAGGVVWWMGAVGDSNPLDPLGGKDPQFTIAAAASGTVQSSLGNVASEDIAGLCVGVKPYSPLLLQSNNVTAAGTLEHYTVGWSDR